MSRTRKTTRAPKKVKCVHCNEEVEMIFLPGESSDTASADWFSCPNCGRWMRLAKDEK